MEGKRRERREIGREVRKGGRYKGRGISCIVVWQ